MIIFLYGEDTFRSRRKLNEVKDKFKREVDKSGDSISVADGEGATMASISGLVNPTSLFTRKRMVIVENIFASKKQTLFTDLLEYLRVGKGIGENIVVFRDQLSGENKLPKYKNDLFVFLRKQQFAQQFRPLSNTEVMVWAKKEVETRGGIISRQALQELTALVGSDLWQINNEIDKLLAFRLGRKEQLLEGGTSVEIEFDDIKELVRGGLDENIFALTDAIGNKNKVLAMKLFEEQVEAGLTESYLMAMIIRQFKILLQIRVGLDQGNSSRKIMSSLKLHPYVAQKGINQVRNYSELLLKRIIGSLIDSDYRLKTGRGETKAMLNMLMARL